MLPVAENKRHNIEFVYRFSLNQVTKPQRSSNSNSLRDISVLVERSKQGWSVKKAFRVHILRN